MTRRQRRAALAIRRGCTYLEAARLVEASKRTIQRWADELPGFRELARAPALSATEVLQELLLSERDEIRLRAAIELRRSPPAPTPDGAATSTIVHVHVDADGNVQPEPEPAAAAP